MSHGAQTLYIALKRRYGHKIHNNGKIFLSQRTAAQELSSHHNQIARWFRELQHFGFIVMQSAGSLGVEGKGQAPRWRLTELGYMRDLPTQDYQRWDGTPFTNKKKPRTAKAARAVQENLHGNVPENEHARSQTRARKTAQKEGPTRCSESGTNLGLPLPPVQERV